MSMAWYRKWRPKSFSEVVGQGHVVTTLRHALERGEVSHAYLFTGPRGVGKTTMARLLAKSVNCTGRQKKGADFDPCNECEHCRAFDNEAVVDVFEIDAASNRSIDDIRALRDTIASAPVRARYKVYIIDEVHMLTKEAFNALLKTLEEPPAHVILVLATTDVLKVPGTILSRCQRFDFHPLAADLLSKHLLTVAAQEKIELTEDGARLLAEVAAGSGRDAIGLLQQVSLLGERINEKAIAENMGFIPLSQIDITLAQCRTADVEQVLSDLSLQLKKGLDPEQYVRAMIRAISLCLETNSAKWAKDISPHQLLQMAAAWAWALKQVRTHPDSYIVLATALVDTHDILHARQATVAKSVNSDSHKAQAPVVEQHQAKPPAEHVQTIQTVEWHPGQAEHQLWSRFIEKAKPHNHTLAALLKDAVLLGISSGDDPEMTIGVHFPFHKGRLMEQKNRHTLEDVLYELTGVRYRLVCTLVASPAKQNVTTEHDDDLVKEAEELFLQR